MSPENKGCVIYKITHPLFNEVWFAVQVIIFRNLLGDHRTGTGGYGEQENVSEGNKKIKNLYLHGRKWRG